MKITARLIGTCFSQAHINKKCFDECCMRYSQGISLDASFHEIIGEKQARQLLNTNKFFN